MTFHAPYRSDIDGLRAIAVLSVLVFHLGVPWLPGGFIGVDVFFVISGYLISQIIYREVDRGEFSVVAFYERRARRIMPAMVAVSAAILMGAWLTLLPNELMDVAKSIAAASLFGANIFFYATSSYFAPAADSLPALHLWSLGVEEQFYIAFPLLIVAVRRWGARSRLILLATLFIGTLAGSEWAARSNPTAAFFLLPYRTFELLLGSLIALPRVSKARSVGLASAAGVLGLGLLVSSLLTTTKWMTFPGLTALPAVVGTALVLWSGRTPAAFAARIMSVPPLPFIGKLSYSLYLVHWPLIVFLNRLAPEFGGPARPAVVAAAAMVLAWLNYRFIEQPFRTNWRIWSRRRILIGTGIVTTGLVATSLSIIALEGLPEAMPSDARAIMAVANYDPRTRYQSGVCFMDPNQTAADVNLGICIPNTGRPKRALIWGDSSAAHLYAALRPRFEQAGYDFGQLSYSACPPLPGMVSAARPYCKPFNDFVLKAIAERKVDLVVMSASWAVDDSAAFLRAAKAETKASLEQTIEKITSHGAQVVLLGSPIEYRRPVPLILAERRSNKNYDTLSRHDIFVRFPTADSQVKSWVERFKGAHFISVRSAICRDGECPMMADTGLPMHFDMLHLTPDGAEQVSRSIAPLILGAAAGNS